MNKIILFCLPHAGGNISFYHPLAQYLPEWIHFAPIEYPGRGLRINEDFIKDFEDMTTFICIQIEKTLNEHAHCPHVIFGHSMGASLGFNAVHKLHTSPKLLCLSSPRNLSSPLLPHDTLYGDEAIQRFRNFLHDESAVDQEIIKHPAFVEYYKPIIMADTVLLNTWTSPLFPPLDFPILVCSGADENNTTLHRWAARTVGDFHMQLFEGGHFYMLKKWEELAKCLVNSIKNVV